MYVRLGRYATEKDPKDFKRDQDIIIHRYDTWSMDQTLAVIIMPMLKQLKATKQGVPNIDASDVPLFLKPTQLENVQTDKNFFYREGDTKRWDYVLDEMIWAFEQIADDDNENSFYDHSEVDDNETDINVLAKQVKVDQEELDKHNQRIGNGLQLFGKYYRSLWD